MKKLSINIIILLNILFAQLTPQDSIQFDQNYFTSARDVENWGYNYDSLQVDLNIWRNSPYVMINSIGKSVQGRDLWQLTITDAVKDYNPRFRVAIHARTHPNETHSFYTTRAIIGILLGETKLGKALRKNIIFNIIPIYNPDGVEMMHGRQNANMVDLERDWDNPNPQPESAALKALYKSYMDSDIPIGIMLNMHNASGNLNRYFVYHDATGTSAKYAEMQQKFIALVQSYWPEGFEDYDYFVSWINKTPTHYPESWFWLNHHEDVLAITYEDTQKSTNEDYPRSANALLRAIYDFLKIDILSPFSDSFELYPAYPNPFNSNTNISYVLDKEAKVKLSIYNLSGTLISEPFNDYQIEGLHTIKWDGTNNYGKEMPTGIYFCQVLANDKSKTKKMTLLR
jgi:hypothetical protein